ncbi:TRAP transporter small permease [Aquisalimonas lutea]|uniref:TRAP transporter small permease n=1 Tax=Aquisalimonas lutea TaxID=1327750 RepID=UPI0025B29F9D|nr:TRAP transporter small permease [Aquisalimonas lutea]MDN3516517.1 TRAP transporter small permease [Aquisalimonas lutea]
MSPTRIVHVARAVRRGFVYAAGAVMVACTLVMGTVLMAGVALRYVFGGGLTWGTELSVILFPWLILAGVVVAAANNEHLGIDYLVRKLPAGYRRALQLVSIAVVTGLMLVIAAQSPQLLNAFQYQRTAVLGWPVSYAFYSLPFGLLSVAAVTLLRVPEVLFGEAES